MNIYEEKSSIVIIIKVDFLEVQITVFWKDLFFSYGRK